MYLWQNKQRLQLLNAGDHLAHAILLRGRSGIGKLDFAMDIAQTLLCKQMNADSKPCMACPDCTWFAENAHPDFRLVSPEDADEGEDEAKEVALKKKSTKKSQISVAQIRQLIDYLSLSTHQNNSKRVIVISPAEALNLASANALLKILEEPPPNTLFLLITNQPQRLLPTILSRCQAIDMPVPSEAEAIAWLATKGVQSAESSLKFAGGAPLQALQVAEKTNENKGIQGSLALGPKLDAFTMAPTFVALGVEQAIDALLKWVFDLWMVSLSQQPYYHMPTPAMQGLSKSVNLSAMMQFQQQLLEAKKTANHPLSKEIQVENMLLQYTKIFK
jgi:DNA polymerase III subunit delta'